MLVLGRCRLRTGRLALWKDLNGEWQGVLLGHEGGLLENLTAICRNCGIGCELERLGLGQLDLAGGSFAGKGTTGAFYECGASSLEDQPFRNSLTIPH